MNILSIIILLLVILLIIILLYFYKKKNIEFFKENKKNKNKNKNKNNYKNKVNEDPVRKPIEEYNNNRKLKDKLFTKYLVGKKEKKEKFSTLATLLNNNNYFI